MPPIYYPPAGIGYDEAAHAGITLGDHGLVVVEAPDRLGGLMDCRILRIDGGAVVVSHYGRVYRVERSAIRGPLGSCGCSRTAAHVPRQESR